MPPSSKPYVCAKCFKGYKQLGWLETHLAEAHPDTRENDIYDSDYANHAQDDDADFNSYHIHHSFTATPAQELASNAPVHRIPDPLEEFIARADLRTEVYEQAGMTVPADHRSVQAEDECQEGSDQRRPDLPMTVDSQSWKWKPFLSEESFNMANWLVMSNTPKEWIDVMLKQPHGGVEKSVLRCFNSAYKLRAKIDAMPDGTGWDSWERHKIPNLTWTPKGVVNPLPTWNVPVEYLARNVLDCAFWLLRQRYLEKDMVYAPQRNYVGNQRVYDELNTGDWWWRKQVIIPPQPL